MARSLTSAGAEVGTALGLEARVGVRVGTLEVQADLEVEDGSVVALVGPNGAGKTTLLRALAGLVALDEGRVVLDGRVLEDVATGQRVPARGRPVGFVFQDVRLFPHLSVLDNVAFGLRARGASRREARRHAFTWLDRLGIVDSARRRPLELSAGQAQRVALARALAAEPALLILDEPLAALDSQTRAEVRRDLRSHLHGRAGVHLLVTHEPLDALVLAERLVVLEGGKVVQQGPTAEVTARPRSPWTADLLGVNLFTGKARGDGVELDGGGRLATATRSAGRVWVLVRPHAVTLHRSRPEGSARNVWRGKVGALDAVDGRLRVRVEATPPVVAEVTPGAVADLALRPGTPVWVAVKATEVSVYPD